jgi:hypothetical protein
MFVKPHISNFIKLPTYVNLPFSIFWCILHNTPIYSNFFFTIRFD